MGQAKAKFDFQDVEFSNFARTLALPARITIIRILLEQDEWVASSKFSIVPLVPEVTERHLNALKTVGLISKMTRDGISYYKLNFKVLKYMLGYFTQLNIEVTKRD